MAAFPWSDYETHPFDHTSLHKSRLDISGSRRVSSLPWRGQFSPELAELLIGEFMDDGTILDPFCGSGTTLIEAARCGHSSVGSEINPAAYLLSRVYELIRLPLSERLALAGRLTAQAEMLEAQDAPFELVAEWARDAEPGPEKQVGDAAFLLAAGNSSELKPGKLRRAFRQVAELVGGLPMVEVDISVALGDARRLKLPDGTAAGLLTSPPYINVFNYHQNYRKAVEALGWGVLSSARAEFGSNRKHRQNRFLTVIQYAQDIAEAITESVRVVRPGGMAVWVVGRESNVRGLAMPNPLIVFEMATRGCGLKLVAKHERSFTSRYGQHVYEDILVFQHPSTPSAFDHSSLTMLGREVGAKVLTSLLEKAGNVAAEVELAISDAAKVFPSAPPAFTFAGSTPAGAGVPAFATFQ